MATAAKKRTPAKKTLPRAARPAPIARGAAIDNPKTARDSRLVNLARDQRWWKKTPGGLYKKERMNARNRTKKARRKNTKNKNK
jgi:hypothetical protein